MKSIKPGRENSMMSGVVSVFAALIGVVFTAVTASDGVYLFSLFGLFFIVIALWNAVRSFRNATSANRYSIYDIVDAAEEPDPMNEKFAKKTDFNTISGEKNFCPYCGAKAGADHKFCKVCGKKMM